MSSVETQRGLGGNDVLFYFIAIAAWSAAIIFSSNDFYSDWIIDVSIQYYLALASAAAALIALTIASFLSRAGVKGSPLFILYAAAAFYAVYVLASQRKDFTPDAAIFLTPIFCMVMSVYFALRHGWGLARLFLLALVIGFAHFYAMDFAEKACDASSDGCISPALIEPLLAQIPDFPDSEMIFPGFVGGIIGAGLSFLGLSIASRGFRQPIILILFTLLLGVVGAIGLASVNGSVEKPTFPYVWLYPPWQIVFGFMLAGLVGKAEPGGD